MESFITTFHIDWKILVSQIINFGIIFVVLYLFALKPLKKVMDERTKTIEKGIKDAKENAILIETTQKEYNDVIKKAREEAHNLFQEGKKEADNKREEMLEKAKQEVETIINNGKKNLEAEKTKMIEEAKSEIVSLVVAATEKVLNDNKNNNINEKVVKNIGNI